MNQAQIYKAAAEAIVKADALLITAGAGMGVDSGLPDFRGPEGFWSAYPAYRALGVSFINVAHPARFAHDPASAWGFYGHRARLYREATPHAGFHLIKRWIGARPHFVVTSNVDGQFQKAGYAHARLLEVHGSIHHLQCAQPCGPDIWEHLEEIPVDPETMRAAWTPTCPRCGALARPNVLMFGDAAWLEDRAAQQRQRFEAFEATASGRWVIIELGAGRAIPTIRRLSERLGARPHAQIIRINPRAPEVPQGPHLPLAERALIALEGIDAALEGA